MYPIKIFEKNQMGTTEEGLGISYSS